MRKFFSLLLVLVGLLAIVSAWEKEDHEIFRLKDELELHEGANVTFYDFLGIKPTASQDDIGKGYRKRSRLLHPDKAKAQFLAARAKQTPKGTPVKKPTEKEIKAAVKEASERFSRLGLIANILRGEGRERYDHFLANGFPAWRGTGYYYSRYRPGLGAVIFGLFVTLGGIGHYVILVTNYKRQKDFVNRYISQARTAAWGDNNPTIANIVDTAGTSASTSSLLSPEDAETSAVPINRRERRAAERGQKKKSSRSPRNSGTSTPAEISDGTPAAGPKRRVTAENGKTLIVDSNGNVFLEEEDEEGETQQFLIDPEEITKPSFQQTIVWRFPVWIVSTIQAKVSGKKEDLKANGITVPRVMTEDGESRGGKKRSHKKKS